MPDEPTLGEVMRRLVDVQATVHELSQRLDATVQRLDSTYIRGERMTPLERRVDALENTQTWLVRTILGVIIIALLALVVVRGQGVGA